MASPSFQASAALTWIIDHHRRFASLRNQGLVIKVGGSIQDDAAQLRTVMRGVATLASLGARPVLVHGGGKAITSAMTKAGLTSRFVQGQRYTDEAALEIAERVLVHTVNRELVEMLQDEGCPARGLHTLGECVLTAVRAGTDAAPGKPSEDLGLVGRVAHVNAGSILGTCDAGLVPVIAPVAREAGGGGGGAGGSGGSGGKLNVNADLVAGTVARTLVPRAFLLVSDTFGVRADVTREDSFLPEISRMTVDELTAKGAIAGGMLPKLQACFEALGAGVGRVCIIDGRIAGSLPHAALAAPGEPVAGTVVV